MNLRRTVASLVAATAAVASMLVVASPASASSADGYVAGSGVISNDFDDEATLSNGGSYWHSNYAGMWQLVLYVDGNFTQAQVDCQFGSQTEAATRAWQTAHGVPSSGKFDLATRQKFAAGLQELSDGIWYVNEDTNRSVRFVRYDGTYKRPYSWDVEAQFGSTTEIRVTWYSAVTFSFCS